jgi:hypothetical protein
MKNTAQVVYSPAEMKISGTKVYELIHYVGVVGFEIVPLTQWPAAFLRLI